MPTTTKFIIAIIAIAIIGYFIFNYRSTPKDVQQASVSDKKTDTSNSGLFGNRTETKNFTMTFTGYGPAGKTETGTFNTKNFSYSGLTEGGLPKNAVMTLDTRTVNTGKDGLNKHLCSDDFFMCEKYPESKFVMTSVEQVPGTSYIFIGNLSFMGVEKSVTLNANKVDGAFVGEFLLDITAFNFKYVGVDPKVLVKFSFEL